MSSVAFPQHGGCLCGELRYTLTADPIVVYACHCTDCQTETGSAFMLCALVPIDALHLDHGIPEWWTLRLPDGRSKGASYCPRCMVTLGAVSPQQPTASLDAGTFDDSSWLEPAGHIWTRSALPWIRIPEQHLDIPGQPTDEQWLELTRAWKQRPR